jgi:hypothetical protein
MNMLLLIKGGRTVRFLKSMLGFLLAAVVSNKLWAVVINQFGIKGGWISALIITGTLWYVNHYKGLINNEKDAAFVDMALGISVALIARDIFKHGGQAFISSIPTFVLVTIGAVAGGTSAAVLEKKIAQRKLQQELIGADFETTV